MLDSLPHITLAAQARRILVTAGRGGVGATTTAALLARALTAHETVTVIDGAHGLRNLDAALGIDALTRSADTVTHPHPQIERLVYARVARERGHALSEVLVGLAGERCIIDGPRHDAPDFAEAVAAADVALVVLTPDAASVRDAALTLERLDALGGSAHLIVQRWRAPERSRRADAVSIEAIVGALGVSVLGVVPDDAQVVKGCEPSPDTPAARAFARIARRILGEEGVPFLSDGAVETNWTAMRRWMGFA